MQSASMHHGTYRGRWCKLIFKNGEEAYDRFIESKSQRLRFEKRGWISRLELVSFEPFQRDTVQKEKMRVAIRELEKPTMPTLVVQKEIVEKPVLPAPLPEIKIEQMKSTVPGMSWFVNRLPSTEYILTLHFTNILGVVRAKQLLGIVEEEQTKEPIVFKKQDFTPRKRKQRDDGVERFWERTCYFCGDIYKMERRQTRAHIDSTLGMCRKHECRLAKVRLTLKNLRARRRAEKAVHN